MSGRLAPVPFSNEAQAAVPVEIKKETGYFRRWIGGLYTAFSLVLWNPWINKHWKFPTCRVEIDETKLSLDEDEEEEVISRYVKYGFGYDDRADDYKVVRLVELRGEADFPLHHPELKVYSLRSNSWRKLPQFISALCVVSRHKACIANRAVHWIMAEGHVSVENSPYGFDVIVAIDFTTEEYRLVPLPDISQEHYWDLQELDGCLCLLSPSLVLRCG